MGDALSYLLAGITSLTWQSVVMLAVGLLLVWLAVKKEYEPLLLLPIGAGAILANIPSSPLVGEGGMLTTLYDMGVSNELFPLLIFVGIGAMTDFGPLWRTRKWCCWARPDSSASSSR